MKPAVINFKGRSWRLHSQTETKLVFVPGENPLAAWLKKKKLTQRDAAPLLGISQGQIARIISGTRTCPPDLLARLE